MGILTDLFVSRSPRPDAGTLSLLTEKGENNIIESLVPQHQPKWWIESLSKQGRKQVYRRKGWNEIEKGAKEVPEVMPTGQPYDEGQALKKGECGYPMGASHITMLIITTRMLCFVFLRNVPGH